MPRAFAGVPECVRCRRSQADHDRRDRGDFDEVQRRIWRALGWPCAQFTLTPAEIYATNQPAVSRWATARRRPDRAFRPAGPAPAAPVEIANRGAAAVRAALGITPPGQREQP